MPFCWKGLLMLGIGLLMVGESGAKAAAPPPPTGFLTKSVRVEGELRRYVLYVPANYHAERAWPLVIFLNGAGECGTDGLRQLAAGLAPAIINDAAAWPFLVLFPQKPDVKSRWEEWDGLVMAVLEETRRTHQVDASRIYLTGLSQGGFGTFALGAKHPTLFAALAPICGGGSAEMAAGLAQTPIWAFHGEADSVVPVQLSRDMAAAVQAAGGDVQLTTYPGVDHNSWDKAYSDEDLGEWFLRHRRK